jgi:hypothetical protein
MFFIAYAINRHEMRRAVTGAFADDPVLRERRPRRRRRGGRS